MTTEDFLIIFAENPELGQVKKRLAKTVGDEKALEIYNDLIRHSFENTKSLSVDKAVFYANFVKENDVWEAAGYEQHLQKGETIGSRLIHAFRTGFKRGYKHVVIMRCDCAELDEACIAEAFNILREGKVVIGPSPDGGYYLIGLNTLHRKLFEDKEWHTENLLLDTMNDLKKLHVPFHLLKTLRVVHEEGDLI